MSDKGAQFLAARIGQDAVVIADLLQQVDRLQARVDELVKQSKEPAPTPAAEPAAE